jgi:DNA-binding transcriptional LysR family regulator
MIENFETLATLAKTGTMMETATVLHISQSAVSKRIDALERHYGRRLIERQGRRVALTHDGMRLVERLTPLLGELRSVFFEDQTIARGRIVMGVSEAILASWGPQLFARVQAEAPALEFDLHAQRSPVVLDRVRAGEYMVGICTGSSDADTDLVSEVLRLEPMVILPSGLAPLAYTPGDELGVITIESRSGAWRSIEEDMRRLRLRRMTSLESFFSVAQMALAGFGHGLVPHGVARTLGVQDAQLIPLGAHGLNRPVRFVARKSTFARPLVRSFHQAIRLHLADLQYVPAWTHGAAFTGD